MFRATNQYDELVVKATDEKLTSEDWAINIDLCDKVNDEKETGARQVTAALQKRLAHRNPNVQLFALELTNTLSENCGPLIHQEIASKAFCEGLERIVVDRTTNDKVRKKVLQLIKKWAQLFENDPDLGLCGELYERLLKNNEYRSVLNESSINEAPPDDEVARARAAAEEEEMQRAIEISKQEQGGRNAYNASSSRSTANPGSSSSSAHPVTTSASYQAREREVAPPAAPEIPNLNQATKVRALYAYTPTNSTELALQEGDEIRVIGRTYESWWRGVNRGRVGIFPVNYVESLPIPTYEEMRREREQEDEVFGSVAKFDMLLEKLRGVDVSRGDKVDDNREIEELYASCVGLQGSISGLIAKYAGQKADLEQISNIFNQASHQYESMRAPPQQPPHQGYVHPPRQHAASQVHPSEMQQPRQTSYIHQAQGSSDHLHVQPPTASPSHGHASPVPHQQQPHQPQHQQSQGGAPLDPAWAAYYAQQAAQAQGRAPDAVPGQQPAYAPQGGQSPAHQHRPQPHQTTSSSTDVSQYAAPLQQQQPQLHPSQQGQPPQSHPSQLHQPYGSTTSIRGGSGSSADGGQQQPHQSAQPQAGGYAPPGAHIPQQQQPPYYQPQQ